jgi:hypothetical protein
VSLVGVRVRVWAVFEPEVKLSVPVSEEKSLLDIGVLPFGTITQRTVVAAPSAEEGVIVTVKLPPSATVAEIVGVVNDPGISALLHVYVGAIHKRRINILAAAICTR